MCACACLHVFCVCVRERQTDREIKDSYKLKKHV